MLTFHRNIYKPYNPYDSFLGQFEKNMDDALWSLRHIRKKHFFKTIDFNTLFMNEVHNIFWLSDLIVVELFSLDKLRKLTPDEYANLNWFNDTSQQDAISELKLSIYKHSSFMYNAVFKFVCSFGSRDYFEQLLAQLSDVGQIQEIIRSFYEDEKSVKADMESLCKDDETSIFWYTKYLEAVSSRPYDLNACYNDAMIMHRAEWMPIHQEMLLEMNNLVNR